MSSPALLRLLGFAEAEAASSSLSLESAKRPGLVLPTAGVSDCAMRRERPRSTLLERRGEGARAEPGRGELKRGDERRGEEGDGGMWRDRGRVSSINPSLKSLPRIAVQDSWTGREKGSDGSSDENMPQANIIFVLSTSFALFSTSTKPGAYGQLCCSNQTRRMHFSRKFWWPL